MSQNFTKHTGRLLLAIFLLLAGLPVFAQFTKSSLGAGYDYKGMATDANGHLYALRSNASGKYDVVKFFNGIGTPSIIYTNVDIAPGTPPYGIAVNSTGDVFVTSMNESVNWEVIKLAYPGYTALKILQGRFITGLAVDNDDNLLTLEFNSINHRYVVRRYPAGIENSFGNDIYPTGVELGSAIRYPTGIAVDAHNNIYFTDFPSKANGIIKVKAPFYNSDSLLFNGRAFSAIGIDKFDRLSATEIISSTASSVIRFNDSSFLTSAVIYNGLHNSSGSYPGAVVPMASGKIFASDGSDQEIVQLTPVTTQLMSFTYLGATPTAASTVNYQVVYSGSVSGVNAGSFTLSTTGVAGASIAGVTEMADGSYTVTVNTGAGSGTVQLTANATAITPPVTNAPLTGPTVVIDKEAPTGNFVINGGATATNNPEVTLTITAADVTTSVDRMRFSIDNGAYTTIEPFATTKTLTIPATEGLHTINITIIDKAGNGLIVSKQIRYDITPPAQPIIISGPPAATSSTNATFNFTLGSDATAEMSLDGNPYTPVTSPTTFTGLPDGNHEWRIRAVDAAGNTSSPAIYTWTIDNTSPVITNVSVPANGYYKAGSSLVFKVKYNEIVRVDNLQAGTPYIEVVIGSTAVKVPYTTGTGTDELTFAYVIRDGENDDDGITVNPLLRLDNAVIADTIGNPASTTYNNVGATAAVKVNTTIPGITLSSSAALYVNAPFSITASFTEGVTDISLSDFTTTNGTLSSLLTTDSIIYTLQLSPVAEGTTSIYLPAGMVTNIGGNPNTVSNTISRTYDTTRPKVTAVAVPADAYYNTAAHLDFTVTFGEAINLNTTAGAPYLTLTIGTATKQAVYTGPATNGASFRYTVADGDVDMDGIEVNALVLNNAIIKDAAGNDAVLNLHAVGSTANVRVSTASPTVVLATAGTAVNTTFTVTATFNEPVTGLSAADFSVMNAAASNLQTTDNITYTVTITPAAEGTVTVSLPATAATSGGNNPSLVSNTLNITYDVTRPVVSTVTAPANGYYRENEDLRFTVAFSENITLNATGGTPYLAVNIGSATVHAVVVSQPAANSLLFQYTVAAGDNAPNGIETGSLVLNGGTIRDAAGNNANVTFTSVPATTGVLVNTTHPSTVLTTTAPAKTNSPFYVNIAFSENVTDATINDVVATNATLSDFVASSGALYSVLVTPAAEGTVTVTIPAGVAVNIAGNGNQAANTLTVTYDITSPTVTQVIAPANGYYKAGDQLIFSTRFNEIVVIDTTAGVPSLSLTIGNSTVHATYYTGDNTATASFRYTVKAGEMDMDGIQLGTLHLNGGIIKDVANNTLNGSLNNPDPTNNIFVNTAHPTVTLSTTAAAVVNTPFTVTIAFSQAVTGFTASDVTATNANVTNSQTTDNISYTVLVTPAADGTVSLRIPADAVRSDYDNGNTASNTLSLVYDATAPVITTGLHFNILEKSAVGTVAGRVTATETIGTLQNWTIVSDDSNGAFTIDANGTLLVNDQAILDAQVNGTITLSITVSDGLNTSLAVLVTVAVLEKNLAPTLDPIDDVTICPETGVQTIQLTGAAATEAGQTYGFFITTAQPASFAQLNVSETGLITYQLQPGANGTITITVTIKDNGGTANGGIDTLRRSFNVIVATPGAISITSDKGSTISKGETLLLTASGAETYRWEDAEGIVSGQQSAVLEVKPMVQTTYHVTASNAAGCSQKGEFTVNVVEDFRIDATNILTPNGDGINDKWIIRNLDSYPDNELTIYDRAGRVVYTRRNYSNDWDGTKSGIPLGEGTYYYILKIDGGAKTAKGYISIIRNNR